MIPISLSNNNEQWPQFCLLYTLFVWNSREWLSSYYYDDAPHAEAAFWRSYTQILGGEDPWIPLGNFMHQFFGYYKHLRPELVRESIEVPANLTPEQFQWAVFCTASVEYLCKKYDISCPQWVLNPLYSLEKPWYYTPGADIPQVRDKLHQTTPEEFARRNIFVETERIATSTNMKDGKAVVKQLSNYLMHFFC